MLKKIFQKRQKAVPLDGLDWAVLALGLATFTAISLWTITKSSIWFDEAFGAYLIRFNFWDIARYTATDVHPPFYYWLLKLWSMVFGMSEFALRSMSVLFAGIAIFLGFLLVKRLFNRRAAWYSLLFMVLAPMLVRYGQEMRMYTLVVAIAIGATYVLTFAMESKKRTPWVLYGVLVGLGMWTHYFSALVWLAHWAWRIWIIRRSSKSTSMFSRTFFSKEWILAHVVAVGLFIPWVPALIRQILTVQINGFWIPPVTPATLPSFFTNVLYYQDQETVQPWMTLVFLVISAAIIVLAVKVYQTQKERQRQAYMLVIALGFVPIILLLVLSMPPLRSSFIDRYLVASVLGISLFMGITLALSAKLLRPYGRKGLVLLIAGAMLFGIANVYHLGNYNKTLHHSNNTRQTMKAITTKAHPGEPIIANSPWLFYEAVFYSTSSHPVYFLNATTDYKYGSLSMLNENDQYKIKDLAAFTREHPIVWYFGRPAEGGFVVPDKNWEQVGEIDVNDLVSNQPSYKAIQYRANAE